MSSKRRTALAGTLALAGIGVALLWVLIGDDSGTSFSIFLYGSALIALANGLLTGWLRAAPATIVAWGLLILIVRLTAEPSCGFSSLTPTTHLAADTDLAHAAARELPAAPHHIPGNAAILATVTECSDGSPPGHDTATFFIAYAAALTLIPVTIGAIARRIIDRTHHRKRPAD
ncbi:MAG: hypothetical protein PGN13_03605 [Patulibacter minatonensis]